MMPDWTAMLPLAPGSNERAAIELPHYDASVLQDGACFLPASA